MGNYLDIGNDGFAEIIRNRYVDKTGLISYINSTIGTDNKFTCVSRPRRFGKSYASQMLCAYYDRSCDSGELFRSLEIEQTPDFEDHLNKYPVLCLDMTEFMTGNHEECTHALERMHHLLIKDLHAAYPHVKPDEESLPVMLATIAEEENCKFVVIIDEWDVFLREMKDDTKLQEEYLRLLSELMGNNGTSYNAIAAAYLTGILPIQHYDTGSDLSHFSEYTMISPGPLGQYAGFTEAEVEALFEKSDLEFGDAKWWYDGYQLGAGLRIYNPKSVMDALQFGEFGGYWSRSETYEALKSYLDMDFDGMRDNLIQLITGNSCEIKGVTLQNDSTRISSVEDVLVLLIHLGYLTYDPLRNQVRIPNEEILEEFVAALENGRREDLAQIISSSNRLLKDTINLDETAVAVAMERVHDLWRDSASYSDEQMLHSAIRLAYIGCIDDYQTIQNLPGGGDGAGVIFIPKMWSQNPSMVVKLKCNNHSPSAIGQIRDGVFTDIQEVMLIVEISYDETFKLHKGRIRVEE